MLGRTNSVMDPPAVHFNGSRFDPPARDDMTLLYSFAICYGKGEVPRTRSVLILLHLTYPLHSPQFASHVCSEKESEKTDLVQ
jgi:hypothetical protein